MSNNLITKFVGRYGRPAGTHRYIPQLDGLRLLAIFLVVVWHISLRAARRIDDINRGADLTSLVAQAHRGPLPGWYTYFPHGEIGVGLFFAMSGFIVAQPFRSVPASDWKIKSFYWRRLHRIAPPYWIMLIISAALVFASGFVRKNGSAAGIDSFIASAFYVHSLVFDAPSPFDPPMWSLEIEALFYIIAPALFFFMFAPKRLFVRLALAVVLLASLIGISNVLYSWLHYDGRFRFGLIDHAYLFIGGIMLADLKIDNGAGVNGTRRADLAFALSFVMLIGLGLYYTQVNAKPPAGVSHALTQIVLLLSSCGLIYGGLHGAQASRVLGHPFAATLGAMCYSIYLVHIVVIEGFARVAMARLPINGTAEIYLAYFGLLLPLSFGVGIVFYLTCERPFMNRSSSRKVASNLA